MSDSLTARQTEVLQAVQGFIREMGMPPTRTDICEIFGFKSPNAADDHLKALERKGYIDLQPCARGITVLKGIAMTATQRSAKRDKVNKSAGLVRISPSHWVKAENRDEALKAVRKVIKQYK